MDINIKVNKATRNAIPDKNKIGVEGENLQEKLVFYFEDEFVDGVARLEYEQDGVKNYIPLTKIDQTYVVPIKNVITKPWKLNLELVITEPQQTEGIPLFKSEIFEVYITNAINAVNEAPEGYDLWIDIANAKIIEIDEKLEDVDDAIEHINDAIQETENLDLDVSDKVDGDVTVTLTKKDASTKTVTLSDGTSLMFNWDGTKLGIKTDEDEEYTYVDLQGIQGPIGPQGEAFQIKKTYSSVAEMNADFDNMQLGDYVMIASTVETEDNAKLYTRGAEQWIFISDFSGATGIQGPTGLTPNIQIGTVVSGSSPSVTRTGTNENPILNFTLVKGETGNPGPIGPTGNGISSVSKTSTSGLIDTYTITYTNATTSTFTVTNGNGISTITKTSTSGLVDTYTITFTNGNTTTFTVTNGEDGEVTQEQFDRAMMVYNALPKVEGNGTEITLNGTANTPMQLELKPSELTQETTTGKNLMNITLAQLKTNNTSGTWSGDVYTSNGITFTPVFNNDKLQYINANGTATGGSGLLNLTLNFELTDGQTYILNGCPEGGSVTKYDLRVLQYYSGESHYEYDYGSGVTFTYNLASKNSNRYQIVVLNGTQVNNLKFYPMTRLSSISEGTYEPYTGGIPQPNPSYPSDVQVIKGNNSIKIESKNLLDFDAFLTTSGATYTKENGVYNITSFGTALTKKSISLLPNTTYTISQQYKSQTVTNLRLEILEGSSVIATSYSTNQTSTTVTFTTGSSNDYYIRANFSSGSAPYIFDKPMIEKGSIASTYVAHQEQVLPLNLPSGMEYCKIGTYEDEFEHDGDKWYLNKYIGKVVLDGTENWNDSYYTQYGFFLLFVSGKAYGTTNLICDHFRVQSGDHPKANIINGRNNNTAIAIYPDDNTATNLVDWKAWLSTHNTIVYYVLSTPTHTEITDTTLISQLNAIENAVSYDEQTNISQTNTDLPFVIKATACKNVPTKTSEVTNDSGFLTQHQDISGKLDANKVKNENSTTAGDVYDVRYINTIVGNIESLLGGI